MKKHLLILKTWIKRAISRFSLFGPLLCMVCRPKQSVRNLCYSASDKRTKAEAAVHTNVRERAARPACKHRAGDQHKQRVCDIIMLTPD